MSYKTLVALVAVIAFIAVTALNLPASAEAGSNTNPSFPDDGHLSFYVDENVAANHHVGQVAADDPDDTTLYYRLSGGHPRVVDLDEETGVLTSAASQSSTTKTRQSTSFGSLSEIRRMPTGTRTIDDDTIHVIVEINNVDEDGTVSLDWRRPQIGTVITASINDIDGEGTGETWQWARCTSRTNTNDCTDIDGATSATYTPVDADKEKCLRATVLYTDAQGPTKSEGGVSTYMVRAVPSGTNNAPTFTDGATTTREVRENQPPDTDIVGPVTATDSDSDDIRYRLGGDAWFPLQHCAGDRAAEGKRGS